MRERDFRHADNIHMVERKHVHEPQAKWLTLEIFICADDDDDDNDDYYEDDGDFSERVTTRSHVRMDADVLVNCAFASVLLTCVCRIV